jgi:hypothetical protein
MNVFSTFEISTSQYWQMANVIYIDITDYIKNHQEKYNEFLQSQQQ